MFEEKANGQRGFVNEPPVYFVRACACAGPSALSAILIDVPVHKHSAVTQAPQWAAEQWLMGR